MSLKILVRFVPSVLILSGLAALHPAVAQFVTFGPAQTISASTDVSTAGTSVAAYNFNGGNATTINNVAFNPTSNAGSGNLSISGADGSYGGYGTSTNNPVNGLDTSYKNLITNGIYTNGSTAMSLTESGLTAGHRYQVQYFVNDSRSLAATRTESVTSIGGNSQTLSYNNTASTTNADGGVGQYANGTFTATTAGTVTLTATGNASTQINGLQFRDLGNAGAPISFGAATAITTADATLGLTGTVITAADFGADNQTVVAGGQTINFYGTNANATVVGGNGTTTGAFSGDTGNTNFNSVLNGFNYDSAAGTNNTKQITLSGLTTGKQYSVQLFGLDDRLASNARTFSFSDFSGSNSGAITTGANDYVLGTFTALSSFETITENLPNNGNINAIVLRDISAAPEPSQIASLALAALGMLGVVLKARKRKASMELN